MKRAIDLGCGPGTTLGWTAAYDQAIGIDIDAGDLETAKKAHPSVAFVLAAGERLPIADESIDAIAAYVSLPYMAIPAAIQEMERVLKPEGTVSLSLHRWPRIIEWWWQDIRQMNWKGAILYQPYILLNGFWLHFFGRQFHFPFNRKRIESFQTQAGMRRLLAAAGFSSILFQREGRRFLVTACRLPATMRKASVVSQIR